MKWNEIFKNKTKQRKDYNNNYFHYWLIIICALLLTGGIIFHLFTRVGEDIRKLNIDKSATYNAKAEKQKFIDRQFKSDDLNTEIITVIKRTETLNTEIGEGLLTSDEIIRNVTIEVEEIQVIIDHIINTGPAGDRNYNPYSQGNP